MTKNKMTSSKAMMQVKLDYDGDEFSRKKFMKLSKLRSVSPKELCMDYYDQYNKPSVIKDKFGNVVGMIKY